MMSNHTHSSRVSGKPRCSRSRHSQRSFVFLALRTTERESQGMMSRDGRETYLSGCGESTSPSQFWLTWGEGRCGTIRQRSTTRTEGVRTHEE